MQKQNRLASAVYILMITLMPTLLRSQVVVGTGTPNGSALLEVQGTTGGVLFPRMTQTQRDAIASPATGLMLYNTTSNCLEVNVGTPTAVEWARVNCLPGTITTLDCAGATVTGSLTSGQAASGVSASVPYTGGNGGFQSGQTVTSTGVTGLTATLSAGNFASGGGNLTYDITGTPAGGGTASFVLNTGGQTCTLDVTVPGSIGSLNCSGATITGSLTSGQSASGVSASVPYTGGNGGFQSGQTVTSTGVTGLAATLSAGNFASGAGSLSYAISGTPAGGGTASFALNIGGQTCTLDVPVAYVCRAKVNATDYMNFMCYNLGSANTSADPFTPTWEINGGYWQWGRKDEAAAGPTGPDAGQANSGAVSGWNIDYAPDGSWADGYKTANDPCPPGYRVPTKAQWDGVTANNTMTRVGTFSLSATNYSAGKKFGDQLMLPAAGSRANNDGSFAWRGSEGRYWCSTENISNKAWWLKFDTSTAGTFDIVRNVGRSVRCIEDIPGSIGSLSCGGSTITGNPINGQSATGVSASVPYTGGDGGFYSGQTVTSTGVTGLTATLSAGNFASGGGSLSYTITGTPASVGTASFALSIGGQTCSLGVTVLAPGSITTLNCAGTVITGTLTSGQAASGVSASVPYTGGDGGPYSGQTVTSTGVTGLTAALSAGSFASGAGNLTYAITGTPASVGTASFALNIGGQTCSLGVTVLVPGSITTLNCGGSTITGTLTSGQAASGVSASVPYTGGDGGPCSGQTVTSTGVTGLTATLSAGSFASGAGNLTYGITGTPARGGTASFALNIGGQTCTLDVPVAYVCRAKINATDYRNFMCYNLGAANTSADPFTPSWEINGGYWQWGRSAQAAAGPTGPDAGQANDGTISGWNTTNVPNGSWADGSKTANDPCPSGYRIPTKEQWAGVIGNNVIFSQGTFNQSATNYGAGYKFGNQLMLPAAGLRSNGNGALLYRGFYGVYWSSTEGGNGGAWSLGFNSSGADTGNNDRTYGLSVRCVAE